MKSTRSPTKFDQNSRDITSIPGHVIEKDSSRGTKQGPSQRQKMCYQAKQMVREARQGKHGRRPTILSRWYAQESYINSLYAIGWREHHMMLYYITRRHFGSRTISVQVNIVEVSDHVFHKFSFEDAMHTTLPSLSSNVRSPYGSGSDLEENGQPLRHDGGKINEIYLQ